MIIPLLADLGLNCSAVAGAPYEQGGRREIVPTEVDEAVRLYSNGQSLVGIAERLGFNAETIRKQLKRRGVVRRPPSQSNDEDLER